MKRLEGKVAIVTGAGGSGAGGTGKEIALRLASDGAKVIIVDLNEEAGLMSEQEIITSGDEAYFIKCDISNEQEVKQTINSAIEKYNKIDILINNAFIYDNSQTKIADLNIEDWDRQFEINCRGHFLFSKYAIPHLIKNDNSVIINISSCTAISPEDKGVAYGASKAALRTMSGYIATQYGKQGLRCNTVMPGLILSDDMDKMLETDSKMKDFFDVYDKNILLNRHGNGKDVANLVSFLVSDEASYITGENIIIDGGMSAHATELSNMRDLFGN